MHISSSTVTEGLAGAECYAADQLEHNLKLVRAMFEELEAGGRKACS